MHKIIETHCHLDYLKARPLEEILSAATSEGVEKIITIAVEPANLNTVMELAQKYPQIYFTQGIHPHDARLCTSEALQTISVRAKHPKMVAIGEIGLDYYYNNSPQDRQLEVFKQHLELAIQTEKPVVIHSRDADEDMINILKEYSPRMPKKGVVHSFSSGEELARTAIDLGFYLGFNGMVTFKKAENVRNAVKLCPLEKILIETDAPFLTPVPHRGKENEPANLPFILEKIAEIKNFPLEKVAEACYANSHSLFFHSLEGLCEE